MHFKNCTSLATLSRRIVALSGSTVNSSKKFFASSSAAGLNTSGSAVEVGGSSTEVNREEKSSVEGLGGWKAFGIMLGEGVGNIDVYLYTNLYKNIYIYV